MRHEYNRSYSRFAPEVGGGAEVESGGIDVQIEDILYGPLWSIIQLKVFIHASESLEVPVRFQCGQDVIFATVHLKGGNASALIGILVRSGSVKQTAALVATQLFSGSSCSRPILTATQHLLKGQVDAVCTDDVISGDAIDLTSDAPGQSILVRAFGLYDVEIELEPLSDGGLIWGAQGIVAHRFNIKVSALLQRLRGCDPEFELKWPSEAKLEFLSSSGDALGRVTLPAPAAPLGSVLNVSPKEISGKFRTAGKSTAYDVFVDNVRYYTGTTASDGSFAFAPAQPNMKCREADISVAAAFTRTMLPVVAKYERVEVPKDADMPSGDWSWITPARLAVQRVTLVIPVYNAHGDLDRCLSSVLSYSDALTRIIAIDDASPDSEVGTVLAKYASRGIEVHRNGENIGYTRTINHGIELAGRDDVILLNSDTVVSSGWAHGLKTAAYSGPRVATATPLSNNAGAFSVPEVGVANILPSGLSIEDWAQLCRGASIRAYPKVPTGNGFCMYIRRDCLDAVGAFDAVAFPVGYGEENDFCMRALQAGYEHVVDDRTYVYHVRSASFGAARGGHYANGRKAVRERYPEYDRLIETFSEGAPMLGVRWRVRQALQNLRLEEPSAAQPTIGKNHAYVVSSEAILDGLSDPMTARLHASEGPRYALLCTGEWVAMLRFDYSQWHELERHPMPADPRSSKAGINAYAQAVQGLLGGHSIETLVLRDTSRHSASLPALAGSLGIAIRS
ncbi:glycosyltransferase family 2 protein [Roseixanthobacter glucoisosaccharinicivorans]|uniref:glycosyltransferase family 2 protein n=1 Tax=Roseixanthobacter glucoisosaccharinicivorans TaxID=3119923 RepID=UPI00372B1386